MLCLPTGSNMLGSLMPESLDETCTLWPSWRAKRCICWRKRCPDKAPPKSPSLDLGNWFDAFISNENVSGCGRSLKSVAWISRRIAERWCAKSTSPVPHLYEKQRLTTPSVPVSSLLLYRLTAAFGPCWDLTRGGVG